MTDEQYSVKRRIKQYQLRRKARRAEIIVRRLFKIFRFILIIALFYFVYRIANSHYWFLPQDIFITGKNVEILGNSIVSNDKILDTVRKIHLDNEPLYKINPDEMVKELELLSPIKKTYIRRFWFPARLVIMVQEVIPAIIISPSEFTPEIAAYSFDGEFISSEYLPLNEKSHAVKILSYGLPEDDYEKWDVKRIMHLYRIVKETEYYSGEKVQYLDLRIPNNAFIQLETVKIRLGTTDLTVFERIKELASMMKSEDVKRLKDNTKYIDLSWSDVRYINVNQQEE